jgi:hypothetical protein
VRARDVARAERDAALAGEASARSARDAALSELAEARSQLAAAESARNELRFAAEAATSERDRKRTEAIRAQRDRDVLVDRLRQVEERLADALSRAAPEALRDALEGRGLRGAAEQEAAIRSLAERAPGALIDAVALAHPESFRRFLQERLVLLADGVEPGPHRAAAIVRVPRDRCELTARSAERSFRDLEAACAEAGIERVVVVGGSPEYHRQLAALAASAPSLRLRTVPGTRASDARRAPSLLAGADLLVIWGATEVDHGVTEAYSASRGNLVRVAHRGMLGMLEEVTAAVRRR